MHEEHVSDDALIVTGGVVRPEWIDYNGHLMDGYYAVAFSAVTDRILELIGFGPNYPTASGYSVYTVESHLVYLREVRAGASLVFTSQILGHDERRIHLVHTLGEAGEAEPAATNELMLLHVRQSPPGAAPMPPAALARLAELAAAQAHLARPAQVGRAIRLRPRSTA